MFKSVQINDQVWSSINGWGEVTGIIPNTLYTLMVKFPTISKAYTIDGFASALDMFPQLFWTSFKPPVKAFIKPKRYEYLWVYVNPLKQRGITNKYYTDIKSALLALDADECVPLYKIEESKLELL